MQSSKISLAISHAPSFIANKKFIEQIPYHYVEQLSQSDCLKEKWDLTNYSHKNASQNFINEKEQLKGYLENYNKKLNGFVVKYNKPRHKWGRVFPAKSLGLTSFAKKTRNTLIKEFYYDFDLSNAQPQILRNICKSNEITHDIIEKYCNERETIMADIISASKNTINRDDVKSLVIRLSFNGGFLNWMKDLKDENNEPIEFPEPVIVQKYYKQVKEICTALKIENLELYKTMERVKREKGGTNFMGSFLSTYLQEYELRIVEHVLQKICTKTNICSTETLNCYIATYEFDGLKLLKERVDAFGGTNAVLDLMNEATKEVGFDINWELKPIEKVYNIQFTEEPKSLKDIKEEEKIAKEHEKELSKEIKLREKTEKDALIYNKKLKDLEERVKNEKIIRINSDSDAVDYLYKNYTKKIIRTDEGWYVRMEGENWYSYGDIYVKQIINNCNFCMGEGLSLFPYSRNSTGCNKIFEKLQNSPLLFPKDNDFINNINNNTRGRVYFQDKYYNLKTKTFHPIDDEIIPLEYIKEEAPDFSTITPEDITNFEDKVLSVFETKADQTYFLKIIGRGVGGFNNDKKWYCMIGNRNSGKGLIQEQVKSSFKGYVTSSDPPIMKSFNTGDASSMRWLVTTKQHTKRVNFTNEAKAIQDKPVELDGEVLKKCISGGDDVLTRLHSGNEFNVKVNTTTIMSFNKMPCCNPKDALLTMYPINTPFKYVDGPLIDAFYKKIDINLKREVETNVLWKNIFRKLVFDAFTDEAIGLKDLPLSASAEYNDVMATNMTEPAQILHNNFIIDPKGFTIYEKIEQLFAPSKYSRDKLAKFLLSRGFLATQRRQKINNKDCRVRGYSGLKLKEKPKEVEISLDNLEEIKDEEDKNEQAENIEEEC